MEQEKSKKQQSKSKSPELDVRLGDLTPDYIEWYGENHTYQEFCIKYIKRRHRVPVRLQKYFNRNRSSST